MLIVSIFIFAVNLLLAGVQSLAEAETRKHTKGAEVRILASKEKSSHSAFIAHLTIPAKGRVPLHRDQSEEYLYVLEGSGTLWIDGKKHRVKKDDLVFMPAQTEVRFENGSRPLKVLQVFAPQGSEAKYESWETQNR